MLRGYSGYNTRWALRVMDEAMDGVAASGAPPPRAVTVFFGANDASLADRSSGYQHVPIDEYGRNLRAICSSFKAISLPSLEISSGSHLIVLWWVV